MIIDSWCIIIFCVFGILIILAMISDENEDTKIEEDRKFKQDIKNFNL